MSKWYRKFKKSFKYGNKGFTLIELLIVIAILGILAAVGIPQLVKFIGNSKIAAANAELGLVKTAIGAAMTDGQTGAVAVTGTLTPTADVKVVTGVAGPPVINAVWVGAYIQGSTGATGSGATLTGATAIPLTGSYPINSDGTIGAATYPGVTFSGGKFQ
jgi:type IV pilus assembly protein PilA